MKFGMFYEHQCPQPWTEDSESRVIQEVRLDSLPVVVVVADHLAITANGKKSLEGLDLGQGNFQFAHPVFNLFPLERIQPRLLRRQHGGLF